LRKPGSSPALTRYAGTIAYRDEYRFMLSVKPKSRDMLSG
jgi:hypothetical protein